jgi:hypothetical protein
MANEQAISSYVLCVDDGGYLASLEVRKVYATLADQLAAERQHLRVIDDTGEDYRFVPINIPPEAAPLFQLSASPDR